MRIVSLLLPLFVVAPALAAPHPLAVEDLVAFDRVGEPVASPDGRQVVFTLSTLDLDGNRRRTDLWSVGADGKGLRRLTSHEAADTSAAFSPDGKWIWFLSSRGGSSQVWRLAVDGGEAEQVTKLPLDVGGFLLSPDGGKLAVALDVFVDCPTLECTKKRLADTAAKKVTGRIYDSLLFRHWDEWADGRRQHVFVLPASGGGEPVDVMKSMEADCPSKPFGGIDEFTFTPDGRSLVIAARNVGREEAWSTNFDLFLVAADGSGAPRNLTEKNPAWDTSPVFSPDGKTLAWLAMTRPGYESDRLHIMVRSFANGAEGAPREIAADWDHSAGGLLFSKDGKTLYTTADHLGHHALFAIDVASAKSRVVVERGTNGGPRLAGDRIVYSHDELRAPAELWSVRADGKDARALTKINEARLASVQLGEPEQFTFAGWNGEQVHAFLVKPINFDPAKKYPIAFLIHGGPQGSFGDHFHYRWNPQIYAAAGYAAVMVDFHGSTGYGQKFTDSIGGDWGGKPLVDLQKGLDAAVAKYPFLDRGRAAALGASFGGFMIYWIAGNWPDGFRCLVAHDGNLDERLAYFDTEELWFPEWDHQGNPWDNPEKFTKHNPIDFVKNWKTPTLVVHGGKDFRVVDTQGMSAFTALQRRGIPSRFLHFPDENHWVLKPQNSILWHKTVLDWLDRWTKSSPGTASKN